MNKPPANDVACRIIVAHHNHLKWLETLFDANEGRDENSICLCALAKVGDKIICGFCTCADGSN